MDRAQGPTQGVFTQNLCGTHTSSAISSGGPLVAEALLRDIPAAWHLTTSTEAADRGMAIRLSDEIYSPGAGVQYTSLIVTESRTHRPGRARLC